MRCPITAQLVGDQLPGWSFLILQHLTKEARSGSTISTFGNQNIDYVSILIDSSPQIEVLTSDFDEELIYMPDVAESPLLPPQIASIGRPELQTPISNCLVRNDAASLSKQEVASSSHPGLTTQLLCFQHLFFFPLIAGDGIVKKPSENRL